MLRRRRQPELAVRLDTGQLHDAPPLRAELPRARTAERAGDARAGRLRARAPPLPQGVHQPALVQADDPLPVGMLHGAERRPRRVDGDRHSSGQRFGARTRHQIRSRSNFNNHLHGPRQQRRLGLLHRHQVRLRHGAAQPRPGGALRPRVGNRRHRGGDVRGHHHHPGGGGGEARQWRRPALGPAPAARPAPSTPASSEAIAQAEAARQRLH